MGGNVESYYDSLEENRRRKEQERLESVKGELWPSWSEYYFNIAHAVKLKSKDQHTKIGAVIVGPDGEIVSTGYNSLPRGINDFIPERYERPEKYNWMEHAERNAIYNAARIGVSTKGCEMYMTCGMSCIDCARAIVQAGISKIHLIPGTGAKETPNLDYKLSLRMFEEAKVKIEFYREDYTMYMRDYTKEKGYR